MTQNNTLRNYFLTGGGIQAHTADYRTGAIVFLHQPRTAGTTFTECLTSISRKHHFTQSAPFTSTKRYKFDNSSSVSQEEFDRIKVITGQYSFGLCNKYHRQCSSFTVFRDPLQTAVSSYEYCKSALSDEKCRTLNANTVTLRDWILHHGSTVYNTLTFNSDWCSIEPGKTNNIPCWKQHKDYMDRLRTVDRDYLLQYILDNMHEWFAVVGIYEEFTETVAMLDKAYLLPFSKCDFKTGHPKDDDEHYNSVLNAVSQTLSNSINHVANSNTKGKKPRTLSHNLDTNRVSRVQHMNRQPTNEISDLYYDYGVRKALEADYKIYARAKELFNRQKEILYNQLY